MKSLSRTLPLLLTACLLLVLNASAQTSQGRWHNIRFADDFAGANASAKINAAISDCGENSGAAGDSCVVVIPPGMTCGEPKQPPDNVVIWDLRGCAQSTGLRFNLSANTTGNVRSKMYIQDNFNAQNAGLGPAKSSATFYSAGFVDSAEVTRGSIAAINGSLFVNRLSGDAPGHMIGIEGEAVAQIPGDVARNVNDIRGGTFNTVVGKNINAKDVSSLVAQAPSLKPGGTIINAYSLRAEAPTVGSRRNLAGWFNGDVQVDTRLTVEKEFVVGGGSPIHNVFLGRGPVSFSTVAGNSCEEGILPVNGVEPGSMANASPAGNIGPNLFWSAWVESAGRVSIRVCNVSVQSVTPQSQEWSVEVVR